MAGRTRMILAGVFLVAGVGAGLGLARAFDTRSEAAVAFPSVRPEPPASLVSLQDSFHAVAEAAMPSVVHITTQSGGAGDVFTPEGVGSGVIVSAQGHILTNNHVVDMGPRTSLRVRFVDGREFPAKVEGTDSESDLALLKIAAPPGLRLVPAVFADSDKVRVGDWCLAIGSPFGYNHTVTAGIVSAKHRRAQMNLPYQDFIQTDAAINPGNSGGALISIRGELIGINTAIISETRSNDGVGLAISSNLAAWVKDRLIKDGKVRRGYLGVMSYDISQDLVDELRQDGLRTVDALVEELGLKSPRGAFVVLVQPDTPAAKAGVKKGDVILEFNGEPVTGQSDMLLKVAQVTPGVKVSLKLLRDKAEKSVQIELAERPPVDLRRRRR